MSEFVSDTCLAIAQQQQQQQQPSLSPNRDIWLQCLALITFELAAAFGLLVSVSAMVDI
jgi:hypothetical protein